MPFAVSRPRSVPDGYIRRQGGSYIRSTQRYTHSPPHEPQTARQPSRRHSGNTPAKYFHYTASTRPSHLSPKRHGPSFEIQKAPGFPDMRSKPWGAGGPCMGWTRPRCEIDLPIYHAFDESMTAPTIARVYMPSPPVAGLLAR